MERLRFRYRSLLCRPSVSSTFPNSWPPLASCWLPKEAESWKIRRSRKEPVRGSRTFVRCLSWAHSLDLERGNPLDWAGTRWSWLSLQQLKGSPFNEGQGAPRWEEFMRNCSVKTCLRLKSEKPATIYWWYWWLLVSCLWGHFRCYGNGYLKIPTPHTHTWSNCGSQDVPGWKTWDDWPWCPLPSGKLT